MTPRFVDGKMMIPIIPSHIQTAHGVIKIDGMRIMEPDEEGYDQLRLWLEANVLTLETIVSKGKLWTSLDGASA